MGLFFAVILTAAIVVIGCYIRFKRNVTSVSIVAMSTDEEQAYKLFLENVSAKIPKSVISKKKYANGSTEFKLNFMKS